MKIVVLRGTCNNGRTCPNINLSDRGTYVVRGHVVTEASEGEAVVAIPLSLLPELVGAALPEG